MILDTDCVIDLMNGKKSVIDKLTELENKGMPLAITSITIFELFNGLAQCSKPLLEREKIHGIIHKQISWPFDDASAEKAGHIHGELVKKGLSIDPTDTMIAGISLEHGEKVLTRNTKHFSRIPALSIETY